MYQASNQCSTALASHSCTASYKSSLIKKTKIKRLTGGKFGSIKSGRSCKDKANNPEDEITADIFKKKCS